MKTNNNQQPIVTIEKEQLQQLCTEVKESVPGAAEMKNMKHQFGVADLWNIRRSTRYRVQRRTMIQ